MSTGLSGIDYWKFSKQLSVIQAALLTLGEDPSSKQHYIHYWEPDKRPEGYEAIISALKSDILSGSLPANIVKSSEMVETSDLDDSLIEKNWVIDSGINLHETTIKVSDLKTWLKSNGVTDCFFYTSEDEVTAKYLERDNEFYAPKLAAAVTAWKCITQNQELLKNRSPKQALEKWLRENAKDYGLTKDDGTPNEQGIGEIAKVANWNISGGATKTAPASPIKKVSKKGGGIKLSTPPTPSKTAGTKMVGPPSDDDIPF